MEGTEQPSEGERNAAATQEAQAPAPAPTPTQGAEVANVGDLLLDIKLLISGFTPTQDKHLNIDGYLEAYTELDKFFGVLGPLFGMVSNEIKSKEVILREHRQSPEGEQYATVGSLLRYEQGLAHGGLPGDRGGRPSGARTLLRLHRALEFVVEFIALLMQPKEGYFGGQVSRLYSATLGRHHGTFIRATTSTALYALPSHSTIMQRMMKGKTVMSDSAMAEMDKAIAAMKAAYNLTQGLYKQYGYLDLP